MRVIEVERLSSASKTCREQFEKYIESKDRNEQAWALQWMVAGKVLDILVKEVEDDDKTNR